jgi:hypothetical protein
MLAGSHGLRRMRKWGAMLVLLIPTAMIATNLVSANPSGEIAPQSALIALATTVFIALGVMPSWNVMTWNPLPFETYAWLSRKAPQL